MNKENLHRSVQDKMDFSGKVVLVTGGSKGIGRACVQGFASLGAHVLFTYRKEDDSVRSLASWAESVRGSVEPIEHDATDAPGYARLAERITSSRGALDVLVNNVGDVIRRSSFFESDDELWQGTFDRNVLSMVRATRSLLPALCNSKSAAVVNVASIAGVSGGSGDSLHYASCKGVVITFTRGLVKELKGTSVRVNAVAPSAIDTDFQRVHSSQERVDRIVAGTPLGRIGTPEEVADAVVFLASEGASFIHGETIMITGGR